MRAHLLGGACVAAIATLLSGASGCSKPAGNTVSSTFDEVHDAVVVDWRETYSAWRHPDPLPGFVFTNHFGKQFRLKHGGSHWYFVTFVFTRCKVETACPTTMRRTKELAYALHDRNDVGFVVFTLDPVFDTPDRLRAFAQRFDVDDERIALATGDGVLLKEALPALFNVMATPDRAAVLEHGIKAAVLDTRGRLVKMWSDNSFTVDEVLRAGATNPSSQSAAQSSR